MFSESVGIFFSICVYISVLVERESLEMNGIFFQPSGSEVSKKDRLGLSDSFKNLINQSGQFSSRPKTRPISPKR